MIVITVGANEHYVTAECEWEYAITQFMLKYKFGIFQGSNFEINEDNGTFTIKPENAIFEISEFNGMLKIGEFE